MGRAGACGDNAAMESFFALLQNVLDRHRWDNRDQLRLAITTRIEGTATAGAANAAFTS
jgi:putative transposase